MEAMLRTLVAYLQCVHFLQLTEVLDYWNDITSTSAETRHLDANDVKRILNLRVEFPLKSIQQLRLSDGFPRR